MPKLTDAEKVQLLLDELEQAGEALDRWGPAAGRRYLRIVEELRSQQEVAEA